MKKIISMGIASAVLALTAVAASADAAAAAPMSIMPKTDAPATGAEYVVEIVAAEDADSTQFNVTWEGLELKDAVVGNSNAAWASPNAAGNNRLVYPAAIKAGDVVLTLTFTVTAAENQIVNVSITEKDEAFGLTDPVSFNAVAVAGDDTDLSGSDSTSGDDSTGDGETTNPPTGIALAIVPAVLAGAGVVVAKKRK